MGGGNMPAFIFGGVIGLYAARHHKGSKYHTYTDIQIQHVFKDIPHMFRKKLISYKHQTGSNLETIKEMIKDKNKKISIPILEKMGFIKTYTGIHREITKDSLEYYLNTVLHIKNVKILPLVTKYLYYANVMSNRVCLEVKHLRFSDTETCIKSTYEEYKILKDSDPKPEDVYDEEHKTFIKRWERIPQYDENRVEEFMYHTGDNIDWKISKWLKKEYNYKSDDNNKKLLFTYFRDKSLSITYLSYELEDGKYYKPVISNNSISRDVDESNEVITLHFVNVDDEDDTKDIEWIHDSALLVFTYYSYNDNDERLDVLYYDQVINALSTDMHFFVIPIKKDGEMIHPDGDKFTKLWLQNVGITLPENISNSEIKDVMFCAASKYKNNQSQALDYLNKHIYGSPFNTKSVSINTGLIQVDYGWEVTHYTKNNSIGIVRTVSLGGTGYVKTTEMIIDGPGLTGNSIYYNYVDQYASDSSAGGKNFITPQYNNNNTAEVYLVPIEGFRKMNLKDFNTEYYRTLMSMLYAEKTVELKWFQTETFQFVLKVEAVAIGYIIGGPVGAAIALGGIILYEALISWGVDPIVATIIVIIVTWGVSPNPEASTGGSAGSGASTTSTAGVDVSTAGANSMSSTTAGTTSATASTTSQLTMAEVKSYIQTFINNFKANFAAQFSGKFSITSAVKLADFGVKTYAKFRMKHEEKKLQKQQNEINSINEKAKEIQDALNEIFENSVTLLPVKFDIEYGMLYADPMSSQYVYDHIHETSALAPLNLIYQI